MIAIWEKSDNLTHWSNKVYFFKRLQNVNEHAPCMEKSDIILWLHTFHTAISQGLLIFDLHKAAFTFFPFFFLFLHAHIFCNKIVRQSSTCVVTSLEVFLDPTFDRLLQT